MKLAREKELRIGSAPDTFLGGGLQTCRKLIDDGWIGTPVAATAFMLCHGHESWHPDPAFFYQRGGGPMLDMGPYYLTALTSLLGPVRRVTGSTRITFPTRTITSQPRFGTTIDVEVPTHLAAVLDFAQGAVATLVTSFDVWAANVPLIEIYGTTGRTAAAWDWRTWRKQSAPADRIAPAANSLSTCSTLWKQSTRQPAKAAMSSLQARATDPRRCP
jgi:predicted dehydrogenase